MEISLIWKYFQLFAQVDLNSAELTSLGLNSAINNRSRLFLQSSCISFLIHVTCWTCPCCCQALGKLYDTLSITLSLPRHFSFSFIAYQPWFIYIYIYIYNSHKEKSTMKTHLFAATKDVRNTLMIFSL